jgi:aminotransferase EvaB
MARPPSVHTAQRDALSAHLHAFEIPHDLHYPLPGYRQPMLADKFENFSRPVPEQLCNDVFTPPYFPEMTDKEVNCVADAVNQWKS